MLHAVWPVAALALATLLPIAPVTLRNWARERQFVLISANAGINLYIGNRRGATGLFSADLSPWGRYGNNQEFRQVYDRIGRVLGYSPTYAEASRFLSREAWRAVRAEPGAAARRLGRKLLYWLGPRETGLNSEVEVARRESALLRRLPVSFAWALALGWAGLVLAGGRGGSAARWVTGCVALPYTLSFLPFFVAGQYRTLLAVPLLALAGVAVGQVARGGWPRRVCWLWLPVLVFCWNLTGYRTTGVGWWFSRGNAHKALEQWTGADTAWQECLRRAVEAPPGSADRHTGAEAAKSAGVALLRQGRAAEAAARFEAGLACEPGSADLLANLGAARLSDGRPREAVEALEAACRARPGDERLRANLAAARLALERQEGR